MDFKKLLNKEQFEAATWLESPVCILAGAGTGKTRVITHRIAYLVSECGARPESIVAVTFTNKAAGEMRYRVDNLLDGAGHRVILGTFHGLAARMLRIYGHLINVPRAFLIYDQSDSERIIKQLATDEFNISKERSGWFIGQIEQWQNQGLLPDEVPAILDPLFDTAIDLYRRYLTKLDQIGAVDFAGLLYKWRDLLKAVPKEQLRPVIEHILVDEYQDTNAVQAEIVSLLAKDAKTVAVVGDDDQTIYGWRGASSNHMREFVQKTPHAKLIKLEKNYRSTETILHAANRVIANNADRLGKNLIAVNGYGVPIRLVKSFNDYQEAQTVIEYVEEELARRSSLDEIAVLMRTNALSRPFEEMCRRVGIPYRLIGGIRFYDRKEIKDILATLRAAINPKSDVDTLRSIGAISRGIGDATVKKIQEVADRKGVSLLEAMIDLGVLADAELPARTRKKVHDFAVSMHELGRYALGVDPRGQHVDLFAGQKEPCDAENAIAMAIDVSGVAEQLKQQTDENQEKLDNIGQLLAAAKQYVDDAKAQGQAVDVQGFLEATALLSSVDESSSGDQGALTLMTLHAAKGLEFDIVFMVGLEEYGFPHARALEEGADPTELEEERRLAYVGMTRARKKLVMTYTQRRMIRGTVKARIPSRFLRELPKECIEGDLLPERRNFGSFSGSSDVVIEVEPEYQSRFKQKSSHTKLFSSSVFEEENDMRVEIEPSEDFDGFSKGARVWHAAFGHGTIVGGRGAGSFARAKVLFDGDSRERVIMARYLRSI